MRIPGYDEYKIGDTFQVEVKSPYKGLSEQELREIIAGEVPESCIIKYDTYIRLTDGDKKC